MFDSGISFKELVDELKNEVDVAIPIPDASYVLWGNSLEHLLYTEIIQEQNKIEIINPDDSPIDLAVLDVPSSEAAVRFEDVYTVFADDTQLIKSTATSGVIFPDTFYKTDNKLGYNVTEKPKSLTIVYFVKPVLKTVDESGGISDGDVMLPIEFIELAKAKLRGEAYKLANEDNLAAKWLNDYNVLLETFKAWISGKQPEFGM